MSKNDLLRINTLEKARAHKDEAFELIVNDKWESPWRIRPANHVATT